MNNDLPPKVSVIVPVYNASSFLAECVKSIINQSYVNIELILVNDGSTDESGSICDALALTDPRIKVIHKQNQGVGKARNSGIDVAIGEFLYFVDADDFLEQKCIETAMSSNIDLFFDIVVFGFTKTTLAGRNLDSRIPLAADISNLKRDKAILAEILDSGSGLSVWDKLIRRDLVIQNNIRFDSKKRSQDITFVIRCFECATTVKSLDKALYYYRQVFDAQKKFDANLLDHLIDNFDLLGSFFSTTSVATSKWFTYDYLCKTFVLLFLIVLPINVSSAKTISFRDKRLIFKKMLSDRRIAGWRQSIIRTHLNYPGRVLVSLYDVKSELLLIALGFFLVRFRHLKTTLKH